jgi:hypothetical protein
MVYHDEFHVLVTLLLYIQNFPNRVWYWGRNMLWIYSNGKFSQQVTQGLINMYFILRGIRFRLKFKVQVYKLDKENAVILITRLKASS